MEAFEEVYNKSQLKNPRKIKEEVIRMFDGNDYRSFEEIYGKDNSLFEDVYDVIDPRKRKLFEEIYRNNNQIRLKEDNEDKQKLTENKEETFEDKYELSEDRKADLKLKEDTFENMYQTEKEQLKEYETYDDLYGEQLREDWDDDDDEDDEDFDYDEALKGWNRNINEKTAKVMAAMGDRIPEPAVRKMFGEYGYDPSLDDIEKIARQFALNKDEVHKLYAAATSEINKNIRRHNDLSQLGLYESKKIKEEGPPGGYNFTGDEPGPSGDGVPASHNKPGIGGSDPATVQSGQDYSRNTKFFESIYNQCNEKVLYKLDEWLENNE